MFHLDHHHISSFFASSYLLTESSMEQHCKWLFCLWFWKLLKWTLNDLVAETWFTWKPDTLWHIIYIYDGYVSVYAVFKGMSVSITMLTILWLFGKSQTAKKTFLLLLHRKGSCDYNLMYWPHALAYEKQMLLVGCWYLYWTLHDITPFLIQSG